MEGSNNVETICALKTPLPIFRVSQSQLKLPCCSVKHENQIQIKLSKQHKSESELPEIQNISSFVHEGKIVKATQICLDGQIINIIDQFLFIPHFQSKGQAIECKQQQNVASVSIHNQLPVKVRGNIILNRNREKNIRDSRNVVKNIFRLFQNWAVNKKILESFLLREIQSVFVQNDRKFNNKLIVDSFKNDVIRRAFLKFCEGQGEEMINDSKIVDKKSHIEIMGNYRRLCLREELTHSAPEIKQETFN